MIGNSDGKASRCVCLVDRDRRARRPCRLVRPGLRSATRFPASAGASCSSCWRAPSLSRSPGWAGGCCFPRSCVPRSRRALSCGSCGRRPTTLLPLGQVGGDLIGARLLTFAPPSGPARHRQRHRRHPDSGRDAVSVRGARPPRAVRARGGPDADPRRRRRAGDRGGRARRLLSGATSRRAAHPSMGHGRF